MPKAKAKAESLNLQTKGMIKDLDKILTNGCDTVVVILAKWCGACKRVKPMWLNALKKKKTNNLVLIDNEVLPETSLNTLDVKYFPSTFTIPAGGNPVLLNNPKDDKEIDTTLHSGVSNASGEASDVVSASKFIEEKMNTLSIAENTLSPQANSLENTPNTLKDIPNRKANQTNSLKAFTPKNGFTPSLEKLKGGRRTNRNKRVKRKRTTRKS
jgi:thiol-disulfide isomerase/thioredoxin